MSQASLNSVKGIDRRTFIGGSDARIIMGSDEAALIRLWQEKRGESEPGDLSLSQPCPPCARPSSKSSLDHCRGDVPTAENGFATSYSVNKSAKVVLD